MHKVVKPDEIEPENRGKVCTVIPFFGKNYNNFLVRTGNLFGKKLKIKVIDRL